MATQPCQWLGSAVPRLHQLQLVQLWSTEGTEDGAGWCCAQSLPSVAAAGAGAAGCACAARSGGSDCAAAAMRPIGAAAWCPAAGAVTVWAGRLPACRMQPPRLAAAATCSGSARLNSNSRHHLSVFMATAAYQPRPVGFEPLCAFGLKAALP